MKFFINLFFLVSLLTVKGDTQNLGFDKAAFYSAMAVNDIEQINTQLSILKNASINEKEAYEGAMLMKKAGLASNTREKLSLFKAGRLKLETSIKKDHKNIEFNFLRLIIQEHAPKVVKYSGDLENDSLLIRTNYKSLPRVIQLAISDYSKNSRVLKSLQP